MTDLDRFTTAQINTLIRTTTDERTTTHKRMLATKAPLSEEWGILAARYDELAQLTDALYAELTRREQETPTDA